MRVQAGTSVSLLSCDGQLNGLTVTDSSFSMDAASTTTLGGSISLSNAGLVTLEDTTFSGGSQMRVQAGTSLILSRLSLPVVPILTGAGTSVQLSDTTLTTPDGQFPQLQPGTMVASTDAEGALTLNPPAVAIIDWFVPVSAHVTHSTNTCSL